jgi:hypothetical protein
MGKGKAQPALFDSERRTRPGRPPGWVVRELVDKWGVSEPDARRLPFSVAFARLYQFRNGGPLTPERMAKLLAELGEKLRAAAADDSGDYAPRELAELVAEAAGLFDPKMLRRVCAGLAKVINEGAAPCQTAS